MSGSALAPGIDIDMDEAPTLRITDLSVSYHTRRGWFRALNRVTLTVPSGQSVALLGPNGSGKSTLLRAMCGMIQPDEGQIQMSTVGGSFTSPERERHLFGVVFQTDSLDPHMTIWENLRDNAALYGIAPTDARHRIERALSDTGLHHRRHELVKALSRGLARRADLCRALLHHPRLLLLDEPTTGLDPSARAGFLRLLEERRSGDGLTVVLCTHLIDEAGLQDRVILLHEGSIVVDGAPEELRRGLGANLVTVHDASWSPPTELAGEAWRQASSGWSLTLDGSQADLEAVVVKLARAGVSYTISPPTLADVFQHHTGRELERVR